MYADQVGANLDVAFAGFSDTYVPNMNWTKLTRRRPTRSVTELAEHRHKQHRHRHRLLARARRCTPGLGIAQTGPTADERCQAIAWFSDGKIDFTPRDLSKPYADGINLSAPNGIDDTTKRAVDSICRPGGLADQLRSSGIIMLGIGLGANKTPTDFDVMSAISTAHGLNGMACGKHHRSGAG